MKPQGYEHLQQESLQNLSDFPGNGNVESRCCHAGFGGWAACPPVSMQAAWWLQVATCRAMSDGIWGWWQGDVCCASGMAVGMQIAC